MGFNSGFKGLTVTFIADHCRAHNRPPLVLVLTQNNPVHTFAPYSVKIHFNIIVHSRLGFQDCLSFRFPH